NHVLPPRNNHVECSRRSLGAMGSRTMQAGLFTIAPSSVPRRRLGFVVVLFAAATVLTLGLWQPLFQRVPFSLYFCAAAIAAWQAGWRLGIAVAVGGVFVVCAHQRFAPELVGPSIVLLVVSAVISLLTRTYERTAGVMQ